MTASISANGEAASVNGDLTYQTVRALYEKTPGFDADSLHIDLGEVGNVDSAGIALLVYWKNCAAAASCALDFTNVPRAVARMAEIAGVSPVFQSSR